MIVPMSELPDKDLDFTLDIYKKNFAEYATINTSDRILDALAFPFRQTIFGRQYLADAILQAGLEMRKDNTVVTLTSSDIYTSRMNYIFGLATHGSALISSARIDPGFWKGIPEIFQYSFEGRPFFERQYAKVLVHELGHALGLPHCDNWDCVMHYSNSPIELYRKGESYCKSCWNRFLLIIQKENN